MDITNGEDEVFGLRVKDLKQNGQLNKNYKFNKSNFQNLNYNQELINKKSKL